MRLVAAKKGVKNEPPEIATADDWSDVGCVALSWVRHSCSYAGAIDGHTSTAHAHADPHLDSNFDTYACLTDCHAMDSTDSLPSSYKSPSVCHAMAHVGGN